MSIRILYVEDDEIYQLLVKKYLEKQRDRFGEEEYIVEVAPHMEAYIKRMELYEEQRPNLILMDIMLPEREGGAIKKDGGLQLAERNLHMEIPIIFITIYSPPEVEGRVMEFIKNKKDIITKPLEDPVVLLRAIQSKLR